MLRLYYTTTKGEDVMSPNFYKSLGGYKSSSLVKNDEFNNFFSEISNFSISEKNQPQYIGLILKNEGATKSNLLLHFNFPTDSFSKLLVAAVNLTEDSEGKYFMENIPSINSSPVYAEFYEADGVSHQVGLGGLDAGNMIGLWFKRELLLDVIKSSCETLVEDTGTDPNLVKEIEKNKSDTIDIVFSYD